MRGPVSVIEPVYDDEGKVVGTRPVLDPDGSPRIHDPSYSSGERVSEDMQAPPPDGNASCLFYDRTLCNGDKQPGPQAELPGPLPSQQPS